jgi:hypothetical protein
MKLDPFTIERIMGQSPCVCGSWETWHPACYKGKRQAQIDAAREIAYVTARNIIRGRAAKIAKEIK